MIAATPPTRPRGIRRPPAGVPRTDRLPAVATAGAEAPAAGGGVA